MPKINWEIVLSDIADARSDLQYIEHRVKSGHALNEEEFRVTLQHVYHHLNFAWNARHQSTERYANLTDEDFISWGQYPADIDYEEE